MSCYYYVCKQPLYFCLLTPELDRTAPQRLLITRRRVVLALHTYTRRWLDWCVGDVGNLAGLVGWLVGLRGFHATKSPRAPIPMFYEKVTINYVHQLATRQMVITYKLFRSLIGHKDLYQ